MPVQFTIELDEEYPGRMAMRVHCPPQTASAAEKTAYEALHKNLAQFALTINARSAEDEQHRN